MPGDTYDYGREAFEFIDNISRLVDVDGVLDAMQRVVARHGFTTLMFSGLPPSDRQLNDYLLAVRCPAGWIEHYNEAQYIRIDPVVHRLKRSIAPFEWREVQYNPVQEPRAAEVMQRRREFGCINGFVVPIHGPPNSVAWVSMSGRDVDLPAVNRPAIHLMALYAFERIRSLRGNIAAGRPPLTAREREVIALIAQGKRAWEISELLTIAKRTVDEHAQTAFRKLGAVNRTQAGAIAIRDRLIEM